MKTTVIRKWGNSIAVRLPKASARKFGLREGTTVRIIEEEKTKSLSLRSLHEHEYTLKELLSRVTPKNRHKLIDWGPPQGKEVW
ncbi:MAG TPA: AbrB/MazE/SpoVT family DNA-binding domain-containing protein [Candidatus Paceibacterota bacterium]